MFKQLQKVTKENKQLLNISNKLSSNDIVCKQMLELLNNTNTNLKIDETIKNSYYVFLNDTIYLSDMAKNTNSYQRICVIAHECIHSVQNKLIQFINFALSNIELVAFVIALVCMVYRFNTNIVFYSYLVINILSIIPRLILEIGATIKSINLSEKYLKNKIDENESSKLLKSYKTKIVLFLPIFIISLLMWKILRLLFIYLIK